MQNFIHKTVVGAALPTNNEAVWTADKSTIGKFTWTLVIIAAIRAQRAQALGQIPAKRHDEFDGEAEMPMAVVIPRRRVLMAAARQSGTREEGKVVQNGRPCLITKSGRLED